MQRAALFRVLKIAGLAGAALLLVTGAGIAWLTATDGGFRYLIGLARGVPGVTIAASGVTGTPAAGFSVAHLTIDHERVLIEISSLRVRVNPVFLFGRTIDLAELSAAAVHVHVKPRVHPPDHTPPAFLPAFLKVTASQVSVEQLLIDDQSGELFRAHTLTAGVALSSSRLRLVHVGADAGSYAMRGDAELTAADPLGLAGKLDIVVPVRGDRLTAQAIVTGSLDRLHIELATQRPAGARYIGDVDLTGTPRLRGVVTMTMQDLAPLVSGAPVGRLDATLTVAGTLRQFTVDGPLRMQALPLGELQLSLEGGYANDALEVSAGRLAGTGANGPLVEGHGRVQIRPDILLDVDVQWQRLRWPVTGPLVVESARGSAHAAGYEPLAVTLAAQLSGPQLPATTLIADASVQSDRVDVRRLSAKLMEGEVAATGSASWTGQRSWMLQASARHLNPGLLRPALRGHVDAKMHASGRGYDPRGYWNLDLDSLSGQVRGRPVSGGGTAAMREGELAVAHARLNIASLKASAHGLIGKASDLEAAAEIGNLGDFVVDGGGTARAHATYVAAHGEQKLNGTLEGSHLHSGANRLEQLTAHADVDTASNDTSEVIVAARGLATGGVLLDTINLAASGTAAGHTLAVAAQSGDRRATMTAHGMYSPTVRREHLTLNTLDLDAPRLAHYALGVPSALDASAQRATLERTCVANGDSTLCLQGDWQHDGVWNAVADVVQLPLSVLPLPLPAGAECLGGVSVHASATGRAGASALARASARLDGVEFRYRAASGRQVGVKIGTGTIDAAADNAAYTLQGELRTTADSFLIVDAHAQRGQDSALGFAPLGGRLRLRTRELDGIPILVRDIDRVSGLLESDITLSGTVGAPALDGTLALTDGAADVYLSNLRLTQIAATVGLHGHALDLDLHAHAGTGQMAASGSLGWDQGKPAGTLKFSGENLLVANLPEARVVASPDVTLAINGQHVDVRGTITIPSATIAPKDLSTAVRISGDQVIVGKHAEAATPQITIDSQVKIVLGSDVRVAAYGLKGLLTGSIVIDAKTDELVTGTGELEVKDGRYLAYARDMDIERGRLLFRGGPVDNAGLDIRASRKFPGYTAGVNVRGTLQAPQLSFFSDPPLPQSQIASLLIVGATNDVGQGGSLLAAQGSALLVGDYTHLVGIDQMTVEADATNGTALVLGKFLSPRLYVSYGISLAQAINTLKLRYTIGDNWVINTESGLNHSADIQYSFQR